MSRHRPIDQHSCGPELWRRNQEADRRGHGLVDLCVSSTLLIAHLSHSSSDCISNIAVPQSFKASQSPRYQDGVIVTISAQATLVLLALGYYVLCNTDNRRREKAMEAQGLTTQEDKARILAGLADETDKRNPLFRYLP